MLAVNEHLPVIGSRVGQVHVLNIQRKVQLSHVRLLHITKSLHIHDSMFFQSSSIGRCARLQPRNETEAAVGYPEWDISCLIGTRDPEGGFGALIADRRQRVKDRPRAYSFIDLRYSHCA